MSEPERQRPGSLPLIPASAEFGETRNSGRRHVHAGAARNVVEDQGQIHGLGHGRIVLIQAFLCGLVVIGRNEERTVRAGLLGVGGKGNRLVRGIRAGACNHRDPPVHDFHGKRDHALVFFVRERGGFPRGPAGHDAMRAVGNLKLDQLAIRGFVECAVLERGDDSDKGS